MAPEMIQSGPYNHTLDIWCLGILLFELVHGHAPFTGDTPNDICQKILAGDINFKRGISSELKDLVRAILKPEAVDRIPLIKVFAHPWVRNFEDKYNLKKVASRPSPPAAARSAGSTPLAKEETTREEAQQSLASRTR